jgi:hypothetical protein
MNPILHIASGPPDTAGGGSPPPAEAKPSVASLTAENAALKSRLAVYEAREKQQLADETLISEKMRAGLRRPQAIAVIKRQRDHDAFLKKQAEEKAAKAAAKAAAAAPAATAPVAK